MVGVDVLFSFEIECGHGEVPLGWYGVLQVYLFGSYKKKVQNTKEKPNFFFKIRFLSSAPGLCCTIS